MLVQTQGRSDLCKQTNSRDWLVARPGVPWCLVRELVERWSHRSPVPSRPSHQQHHSPLAMQQFRLARDDNHNDRTQHQANILAKESGLAALEAFQREYLPAMSRHTLPSLPSSPPTTPSPALTDTFHHNASFDEQFKDVSQRWSEI